MDHESRLIRQLLSPRAYSHAVDDVKLYETHISWVLLAGKYAYKLKKPVNLGFLDLSTPDKRLADCQTEVALNQRLCPDVYLDVVHVVERDGQIAMGGAGQPLEPAVRMRRLPEEGMLPELLESGRVSRRLVERIARQLAAFHATASTGSGIDAYGSIETMHANWRENFEQTTALVSLGCPDASRNDAIREYVTRFVDERRVLLERRIASGRIRDGHGDMHAASICVEGRKIHFFDCLAFATRFRCADVASEVAFLVMDLAHRGRTDLAGYFRDAYVAASGDRELLELLDFYASYRAYVRGKVLGLRLLDGSVRGRARTSIEAETRAYFDLAWAYARELSRGRLFVCMGLPASGKTTLARKLSRHLGLVHVSSDVVRKELAGVPAHEHAGGSFGQGLYTPAMSRRTYATVHRRAARWLDRGTSVVLDATYGSRDERSHLRELAQRCGARLTVFVCDANERTLRARLAARARGEESGASDARLELWPALKAAYSEPSELPGVVRVDTGAATDEAVSQAISALTE